MQKANPVDTASCAQEGQACDVFLQVLDVLRVLLQSSIMLGNFGLVDRQALQDALLSLRQ